MLTPIYTEEQIQGRVAELAQAIRTDYGPDPLLLLGILKGSFVFISDLCRHLGDNVTVDFVQISSYGSGTTSDGNVQIRKDLDINIQDLHVLVVEDIVDSGATLNHLLELLATRHPRSLKVVSLLSKPGARLVEVDVDYVGFEIPNVFVVGYGLDLAEKYRNLSYIASIHAE